MYQQRRIIFVLTSLHPVCKSSKKIACKLTLSKPDMINLFPRTSPTPAKSVTGFSPMGSATKLRCFCDVLDIIEKITSSQISTSTTASLSIIFNLTAVWHLTAALVWSCTAWEFVFQNNAAYNCLLFFIPLSFRETASFVRFLYNISCVLKETSGCGQVGNWLVAKSFRVHLVCLRASANDGP